MPKESLAVSGTEGEEAFDQGVLEFIEGAGGGLAQMGFEFGERLFDGVEIRAVSGQVADTGPLGRDEFSDALGLMGGEVVEDDDVTHPQFRTEHLPEVNGKDLGVDRSFDQKRCADALGPQGGDERRSLPVAVRNGPNTTLTARTTPVESGQFGVQARFVEEDQPLAIPAGLRPAPTDPGGLDVRPILLGGARRFFYSSSRGGRAGAKGH